MKHPYHPYQFSVIVSKPAIFTYASGLLMVTNTVFNVLL